MWPPRSLGRKSPPSSRGAPDPLPPFRRVAPLSEGLLQAPSRQWPFKRMLWRATRFPGNNCFVVTSSLLGHLRRLSSDEVDRGHVSSRRLRTRNRSLGTETSFVRIVGRDRHLRHQSAGVRFPLAQFEEVRTTGFRRQEPPFPVPYDWGCAGELFVEGSEFESLRPIDFTLDEGVSIGARYCSLANKHRAQVISRNRMADPGLVYWPGSDDRLSKMFKAFGQDALRACDLPRRSGSSSWEFDGQNCSVAFCFDLLPVVRKAGITVAISFGILERRGDVVIRELVPKRVWRALPRACADCARLPVAG